MALLATVTFKHVSGMLEDSVTNTFAFTGGDPADTTHLDSLADELIGFYNATNGVAAASIASFLSPVLSRVASDSTVRIYDIAGHLAGEPHGSPVHQKTFTLGAAVGTSQFPEEVAMVLTLEANGRLGSPVETADGVDADGLPDRPMQRRTGRIYLGPLNASTGAVVNGRIRPVSTFTQALIESANDLRDDISAFAIATSWAVWSRKDAAVRAIDAISFDDAFDTQRRRGPRGTVRTRVSI